MTVVHLETEASHPDGAIKAELSDGSSFFVLADCLYKESADYTGRELSAGEEEAFRFAAVCYKAEKAALRLIARAEQNSFGLTAKLVRHGFNTAVAKSVISRLLDRNLLDDTRYAELWIRSRLASVKAPSPKWLLAGLSKKGIGKKCSLKALEKVLDPETEYTLLLKYLSKARFPESKELISARTQLKHKGFSSTAVSRYIDSHQRENGV